MTIGSSAGLTGEPRTQRSRATLAREVIWVAALGTLGAGAVFLATTRGVGMNPDSAAYRAMAEKFARDPATFFRPGDDPVVGNLNHWGSFLGLVLASLKWTGIGLYERARGLDVLLGGLDVVLLYVLVRRHVTAVTASIVAVAFLTFGEYASIVGSLLSEGLFIALMLVTLNFLDVGLDSTRWRNAFLAGAALMAAMAATTRIVGAVFVGTVVLSTLWFSPRGRKRWVSTAIVTGCGLLPWLIWRQTYGSDASLGFHPPMRRVSQLLRTLASRLIPDAVFDQRLGAVMGGLVAIAFIVFVSQWFVRWAIRSWTTVPRGSDRTVAILVLTGTLYALFVLASDTFVYTTVPLDTRLLIPAWACVLAVTGIRGEAYFHSHPQILEAGTVTRRAAVGVAALWLGIFAVQTAYDVRDYQRNGIGYASSKYQDSPTLGYAESVPPGAAIYTNARAALFLLHDRVSRDSPFVGSDKGVAVSEDPKIQAMIRDLKKTNGVVIYADSESGRSDLPKREVLKQLPGLQVLVEFEDGMIVGAT